MIKACIFDLDGTLADTIYSMSNVANQVMRSFDLDELPAENFKYYSGEGASVLIQRCLKDAGDPDLLYYEKAEAMYRKLFNVDPLYKVKAYEEMPETLEWMKERNLLLAVCTNKPDEAAKKVVHTLYGNIFECILGQQPGLKRKPSPEGALMIAAQFGVKPEECLYVGDTATDIRTGQSAGMCTVGALWGFRTKEELKSAGAAILAESPSKLREIVLRNGRGAFPVHP